MTVLVITDEPKKWAHEVLKFLNKEYLMLKGDYGCYQYTTN